MIAATFLAVVFVPLFFVTIQKAVEFASRFSPKDPHDDEPEETPAALPAAENKS